MNSIAGVKTRQLPGSCWREPSGQCVRPRSRAWAPRTALPASGRQDAGGCGRLLPWRAGQDLRDAGAGGAAWPGAHRPPPVLRRLPGGAQRGRPALHGRAAQVPSHADLLQVLLWREKGPSSHNLHWGKP